MKPPDLSEEEFQRVLVVVRHEMLRVRADYVRDHPWSDWDVAVFAAWCAASREAQAWQQKAMILTGVLFALCLWIVWKL